MIAVVDFGMGNIHSCLKAFSNFTNEFELVSTPQELEKAKGIVLPGDGAFQKAMENLNSMGLSEVIKAKVKDGLPIFGICIGFQLLFETSEESLNKQKISGFGFLKGHVKRFKGKNYKVPHMGWNRLHINPRKQSKILQEVQDKSYMYFIHSYRPVDVDYKVVSAECAYYDEKFPVVVEKENIFGTQFHPEKSHKEGLKILKNFIQISLS
ncbi:MAG: imidazole glycerol phosphate synthase subunit HisH [Leptospiraceae bacterium]|nr:imidazole glycerol phosphate synthase subunit HisH [Leptospiraceae bacterium]